jgi:outer membrane biosynthesis protein TonB
MNRFTRITLIVPVLSLGFALAGCESFDPTAIFDAEIFNTKKKLPGDRQAVFPEGTPGVQQGVPQELVKGYQQPEVAPPPQQAPAAEAKPKPKPKPKVVAKPKEESTPTAVTVRPSQGQSQQSSQQQWPDPPQQQQRSSSGGVAWPDPPPVR